MASVLIIDDDELVTKVLAEIIQRAGCEVTCAFTLKDGLEKAFANSFDVILLDVILPDGNSLQAIPKLRNAESAPEIIVITGNGSADGAELALRSGAWDYINKPATVQNIMLPLRRALQYREQKKAFKPVLFNRQGIVGNSPQMNTAIERLAQAAGSDASVIIHGETGTGKELFARALHANSGRADKRFVVVDCSALPESLVESLLFGHEKGTFTGADRAREGLIRQADGGTLFLDEIGELPLILQKTFLRVLQEHRFRPIGAKLEVESDFRLVAATNKDLKQMVLTGEFRDDLLFRLSGFSIRIPPLRERPDDIAELVYYYLNKLSKLYGISGKGFSPEFIDSLVAYHWPGNVRELANTMEQVFAVARHESTLYPKHLPVYIRVELTKASLPTSATADRKHMEFDQPDLTTGDQFPTLKSFRDKMEQQYLRKLIQFTKVNKAKACQLSGLSRSRLFELLKKHHIERDVASD